jgi:hypothetical protein
MSKHIPVRTCVVCREKGGKRALIRIVRTEQGVVSDLTGKLNGRGAYLCHRSECWEKALRSDILEKALRTTLSYEDREHLRAQQPQVTPHEPETRAGSPP